MTKRKAQHAHESAADYLLRVADNLKLERGRILDRLPTTDAVLDFLDVWHKYDTDLWDGVIACIEDGEDPEPARAFCRKHKVRGDDWLPAIRRAVAFFNQRKREQAAEERRMVRQQQY